MRKEHSSITTTSAIILILIVGIIAFAAGTRAEKYNLFTNSGLSGDSSGEGSLPNDLSYGEVESLYDKLRSTYDGDLTEDEILDGIKKGLAESTGDPYTVYLNQEEAQQFEDDLNGTFTGIGAEIGLENEIIVVIAPLKGFPAEQAGLRSGDAIIKIGDEDTFGLTVEEAVRKIRGEKGTDVTLTIIRGSEQKEITITRDEIVVPSVEWEIADNGIGYLEISRFAEDTTQLTNKAANEFIDAGVKGVVVDLRNNSGGFLQSAVDVSGLWIDGDVVTEQREAGGKVITETLRADKGAILGDFKTVVLVNKGSASASEIVAGALKDYGAAVIVGETTFGKGSVQSLERLNDGGVLKVTIARWYTPEGANIDKDGVTPDHEVERTDEDFENDRDPQKDKATAIIIQ